MYPLLRSILFLQDPEKVHYFSMRLLKSLCNIGFIRKLITTIYTPKNIPVTVFGLPFKNIVGLAAGFDKNASYLRELETLGFSHIEIGTVTPIAQAGNDKPRLFRLPNDRALINRMGFNNDGAEVIALRLKFWKSKNSKLIIGGNIGKNKLTPNEDAWMDYEKCFLALHPFVDYFVVNVSSPNTPGLRALQEKNSLLQIFTVLQNHNSKLESPKPLLLKIAPDLSLEQLDDVITLALEIKLDGLVACNTTLDRTALTGKSKEISDISGMGGLSGYPVKDKSTEIISYIFKKTNGIIPIIGSGGIFTAKDAKEKLDAGATLLQVWTGFVYEGPGIVKKICSSLYRGASGRW